MTYRVPSGVNGLNKMLNGGFIPGTTVLVSGQAGTGKTTFAMQFLYEGAKRGEPGLFITMEQDKSKLIADMASLGMNIPKMKDITIVGGSLGEIMRIKKKVKGNMENFLEEIEEIIREKNIKRVSMDSINLFLMLFDKEEDRRYALLSLTYILGKFGCTAIFTSETRDNSSLSWYGFEEFVVDNVISLTNIKMSHYFKHALCVRKMRGSPHDKSIVSYDITSDGVIVNSDDVVVPA